MEETKKAKRIVLETFEVRDGCTLKDFEIKSIKADIEYTIQVINEGLDEGRDRYLDGFIQSYIDQLVGMRSICSHIGLFVKTPWVQI